MLGKETARLLEAAPAQFENSPRLRAFVAARSRFSEEELAAAFHRGARQLVVLGAGLDTFAYRNPFADAGLRVFEVDHPATQTWKRELLGRRTGPSRRRARSLSLRWTLNADARCRGTESSRLPRRQAGVLFLAGRGRYLTLEAAQATLAWIGSLPAGSDVVFDYAISPASLGEAQKAAFDALASRVARAGEPFRYSLSRPNSLRCSVNWDSGLSKTWMPLKSTAVISTIALTGFMSAA